MKSIWLSRVIAWGIALTLLSLPLVGVLNGWFAADRWPVTTLDVSAPFEQVGAEQIRAAALPELDAGFFAMDLEAVRAAVEKLPWVERVDARKRWPDALELVVHEYQPWARWGEDQLISRKGSLFKAPEGPLMDGLPELSGPPARLGEVLQFHVDSLREFSGSGLVPEAVVLSERGSWSLRLSNGAWLQVGRVAPRARLKRFLDTWPQLAGERSSSLAYVDLRYEHGFAVHWAPQQAEPEPPADVAAELPAGSA